MNLLKRINRNNFTCKRLKVEASKKLIDAGFLKGNQGYQKFIILARSRVGTNLLISYLNSHPNIFALGEMWGNNHHTETIAYRKSNPLEYLSMYCYRGYDKCIKAVGFKIFYYHPVNGESRLIWNNLQDSKDIKVIHLKRSNILRTHLSRAIAGKTDKWTVTGSKNISLENKAVKLSADECLKVFQQTRKWETEADDFFKQHSVLEVNYEDLISDAHNELEKVQNFLDLPLKRLKTSLKKQNPEPLSKLISNYSELKNQFENTEWIKFFED